MEAEKEAQRLAMEEKVDTTVKVDAMISVQSLKGDIAE